MNSDSKTDKSGQSRYPRDYASSQERIVPMRLQKFLARAGAASRRGSEALMSAGRVTVNGRVVTELGSKVDPNADTVAVDGRVVTISDVPRTIMLHKPSGFVTTMSDPHARRTVAELVPVEECPGLFPIGRLDKDTTGLLLFSTDGDLGNALLHPSHHVDKTYEALVSGRAGRKAIETLESGVKLEDGPTAPAIVRRVPSLATDPVMSTRLEITIHEGRKRQVRRMCEAVGHEVISLHRSSFGPLSLGSLEPGSWRELSSEELAQLGEAAGIEGPC